MNCWFWRLMLGGFLWFPLHANGVIQFPNGGPLFSWPANWVAIPSLNDMIDAGVADQLDFVGDPSDPAAYWTQDTNYFYARIRVDIGAATAYTFNDAVFMYIDRVGWGNEDGRPDYSVAWDSKSSDKVEHGMELQVPPGSLPGTWGLLRMADRDGNAGRKISPPDFNTTGNGYIRTLDSISTAHFGTTTFIDFAVSWEYLGSVYNSAPLTTLAPGQTWRLAFGSVQDATDHAGPTEDVAGGASPDSSLLMGWSDSIETVDLPEPASIAQAGVGAILLGAGLARRRRRRSLS